MLIGWLGVHSALMKMDAYGKYLWINENPDQYEDLILGLRSARRMLRPKIKPYDGSHDARMDLLHYAMDCYYVKNVECVMATMPMNRFIDEVERERPHAYSIWGELENITMDLLPCLWRMLYPRDFPSEDAVKHLYHHLCVYLHHLRREGPLTCRPDKRLLSIVFSVLSFCGTLEIQYG